MGGECEACEVGDSMCAVVVEEPIVILMTMMTELLQVMVVLVDLVV